MSGREQRHFRLTSFSIDGERPFEENDGSLNPQGTDGNPPEAAGDLPGVADQLEGDGNLPGVADQLEGDGNLPVLTDNPIEVTGNLPVDGQSGAAGNQPGLVSPLGAADNLPGSVGIQLEVVSPSEAADNLPGSAGNQSGIVSPPGAADNLPRSIGNLLRSAINPLTPPINLPRPPVDNNQSIVVEYEKVAGNVPRPPERLHGFPITDFFIRNVSNRLPTPNAIPRFLPLPVHLGNFRRNNPYEYVTNLTDLLPRADNINVVATPAKAENNKENTDEEDETEKPKAKFDCSVVPYLIAICVLLFFIVGRKCTN